MSEKKMAKTNDFRVLVMMSAVALAAALLVLVAAEKPAKAALTNGWIAFVSDRDTVPPGPPINPFNDEIYVQKDEAGSEAIRLTNNPAIEQFPAVSPNGKEIAFTSNRTDDVYPNPERDPEIYVMDANDDDGDGNGDNLVRLTDNAANDAQKLNWSPEGKKIAFTSFRAGAINQTPDGDVYVMDAEDGSEESSLTNEAPGAPAPFDGQPVFSPDGSKIAFMSARDGNQELYVMDAKDDTGPLGVPDGNGDNPTRLTYNAQIDAQPEFSPDGTHIAFTSSRDGDFDIWVMKAEPESATNVPINLTNAMVTNERWPAWSPDGGRMALWSGIGSGLLSDSEIYVMNTDTPATVLPDTTNVPTNLTNNSAGEAWPDWGPAPEKQKSK